MSYQCETFLFAVRGILSLVVGFTGLVGNALSIFILNTIETTSATFLLLRVLAIADTIYLIAYIITAVVPEFFYFSGMEILLLSDFQYIIWGIFPIASMALTVTVWITTMVTVQRFLAFPLRSPTHQMSILSSMKSAVIQLTIVVCLSVVVDIPKYFESKVIVLPGENGTIIKIINTTSLWYSSRYQLYYKNIAMIGLRKILPIIITSVLTILLIKNIMRRKALRRHLLGNGTPKGRRKHSDNHLNRVLISVAFFLVICQSPMAIYPLFRIFFSINTNSCNHFYYYFSNFADWLALVNSAANFFIYYPSIPSFRQRLVIMFSRKVLSNVGYKSHHLSNRDDLRDSADINEKLTTMTTKI